MAFNELERKRIEKTVDRFIQAHRPPPHIRPKLDLGFRLQGQSVELFEIRPVWDKPSQKMESPFRTWLETRMPGLFANINAVNKSGKATTALCPSIFLYPGPTA